MLVPLLSCWTVSWYPEQVGRCNWGRWARCASDYMPHMGDSGDITEAAGCITAVQTQTTKGFVKGRSILQHNFRARSLWQVTQDEMGIGRNCQDTFPTVPPEMVASYTVSFQGQHIQYSQSCRDTELAMDVRLLSGLTARQLTLYSIMHSRG